MHVQCFAVVFILVFYCQFRSVSLNEINGDGHGDRL